MLPAGTEIAYALGLGDQLVGRSHECDYPAVVKRLPVVSRPALDLTALSQSETDAAVARQLASGESLYLVDEALLRKLAPDVILTQDLCQVCAPSGNELTRALRTLEPVPQVVYLTPRTLAEIEENIRAVGDVGWKSAEARQLVDAGRARVAAVSETLGAVETRPRVSFLEWVDPIFCAGHWVPEVITLAGGTDRFARAGEDSQRVEWSDIVDWAPEYVFVAPCGYDTEHALPLARALTERPGWSSLPAVRSGHVYVVDANGYFARPGPRTFDGVELLAHLMHPEIVQWRGPREAWAAL